MSLVLCRFRAVCGDCIHIRRRRLFVGRIEAMALEANAEQILNTITPNLDSTKYKGQAGRVAVIGGCREYTGAPYFAAISALKIGADLSHVFCTKDAATVIKGYSPELIVHPLLEESYNIKAGDKESTASKILAESQKWMERFDCLVVGPGLGRDPFILECVGDILSEAKRLSIPVVIDGDGLFLITNRIDLVEGYRLAVLTPNVNEYKHLVARVLNSEVDDQGAASQLLSLSKQLGGVTVLKKGESDLISDGAIVTKVSSFGSPRRCGGQGDVLSGCVAVFSTWAREHHTMVSNESSSCSKLSGSNPLLLGCVSGSVLVRKAAFLAFTVHERATVTGDIISFLGKSMETILGANRGVGI